MKQTLKKVAYGLFLFSILSILFTSTAAAETTVEYTIEPETPALLSEVKVTAEIKGDDITSVYLEMQECNIKYTCFGWDTNVSMTPTGEADTYEAKITLEHDDAKYFSLRLAIERNGDWELTDSTDFDVDRSSNGNGNGSNDSPGFEIIGLLAAILVGTLLYRRKRS